MADGKLYPREGSHIVTFPESELHPTVESVEDCACRHLVGEVVAAGPNSDLRDGDTVLVRDYDRERIDAQTFLVSDYAVVAVAGRKPGPRPRT